MECQRQTGESCGFSLCLGGILIGQAQLFAVDKAFSPHQCISIPRAAVVTERQNVRLVFTELLTHLLMKGGQVAPMNCRVIVVLAMVADIESRQVKETGEKSIRVVYGKQRGLWYT